MKTINEKIVSVSVSKLKEHPHNPRRGDDDAISKSIQTNGFYGCVVAQKSTGFVLAGNHRLRAAIANGADKVPVAWVDIDDAHARKILAADNRTSDLGGYDDHALASLLDEINADLKLDGTGYDVGDLDDLIAGLGKSVEVGSFLRKAPVAKEMPLEERSRTLIERFIIPPFSVLDTRQGYWQDRRGQWLEYGIRDDSDMGRKVDLIGSSPQYKDTDFYDKKRKKEVELGRNLETKEFIEHHYEAPKEESYNSGTSIFDPVLCEIIYKWFSGEGMSVLDPFAGGSVRGLIAAEMGREYTGVDLRPEQVEANQNHCKKIRDGDPIQPLWICGDSLTSIPDAQYDMVMSCPPYADLEVYSDDAKDLSNMSYDDFVETYKEIIKKSCAQLKEDSFAVFVIGEVRNKKTGAYRGFVQDTISAFTESGLSYESEAILVTNSGSAATRAGRSFPPARRMVKTHQNVLVFCKGDPKKAAKRCGELEVPDEGDEE